MHRFTDSPPIPPQCRAGLPLVNLGIEVLGSEELPECPACEGLGANFPPVSGKRMICEECGGTGIAREENK